MSSLQEKRAEETRNAILSAAGQLFSDKGYAQVSMREIAKAAGCSHTTIYIYFKDKEALLHQLSVPPLEELRRRMEDNVQESGSSGDNRMRNLLRIFIEFCVANRGVYKVLFATNSVRVDEAETVSELNRLRLGLFDMLKRELGRELELADSDRLLAFSRIMYYQLSGIADTYAQSDETTEALMARLAATFDLGVEVLLLGFKAILQLREDEQE